ncbi:DUF3307 domain-containing protein [Cellulophaga baltica]|uniref:DUF3307 domain-containing protein n=1 Tax=Cellulophaga TaxID=104264 RepID=UPI001C0797FD|nr:MULTISPECIES: DUF3307 domain-containing protein [Cellulophaga]MBU2997431.1 DUF3307 domain-containing protein [Cellulophaga baltica]MDO6768828.1 DUF3307 domain-containing protein [Cellulophaga sp. 1_MG-2023]
MILFIKLFLAHLIGDFMLQPTKWVVGKEDKKVKSKYLYYHVLLHFLLAMLLLWNLSYWKIGLVVLMSHYAIDTLKLYVNHKFKNKSIPFFIDQLLHVLVLYVCAYYGGVIEHTWALVESIDIKLVTAFVFVSFPTAVIIGKLLEGMSKYIEDDHESLPNAGMYIGIIERFFVLAFILLGRWEVIGFLIAAKSVFRFNDLKESNSRELTEYILIGTLLSFGIAILTGVIYLNF